MKTTRVRVWNLLFVAFIFVASSVVAGIYVGATSAGGENVREDNRPDACAPLPQNAVSWWRGEGNADDVLANNNGTLQAGVGFGAGRVGQGFSFDGVDDLVSIPDSPSVSPTSAISVDAWVKPNATGTGRSRAIITKYDSDSGQNSFALFLTGTGQVVFAVYSPGLIREAITGTGLSVGVFAHVAATFDTTSQTIKIYLNGVDSGGPTTGPNIPVIFDSTAPVRIGALRQGAALDMLFDGVIDEVDLLNRVLLPSEIQGIYNAGSDGKCLPSCGTAGSLDPSFDNDGKVVTAVGGGDDYGTGTVLQPDGKIVVVGSSPSYSIVRYNSDGSLDTTFGGTGKVTTVVGDPGRGATGLALQPDGKIIAVGAANSGNGDMGIVRYNADGSLDTSFDGDGIATTSIPGTDGEQFSAVVVQSDGKDIRR